VNTGLRLISHSQYFNNFFVDFLFCFSFLSYFLPSEIQRSHSENIKLGPTCLYYWRIKELKSTKKWIMLMVNSERKVNEWSCYIWYGIPSRTVSREEETEQLNQPSYCYWLIHIACIHTTFVVTILETIGNSAGLQKTFEHMNTDKYTGTTMQLNNMATARL